MAKTDFHHFTPFSASGGSRLLERAVTSKKGRTYRGVTLVKVGRGNKDDNNYYPAETLREAAKQGLFEGLRAFADHPTAVDEHILPERSIRDIVGIYTNTKFRENKVVGDLTVFRKDEWLSSMVDDLLGLEQADKVGISINGAGKTVPKQVRVSESGESQEVNWLESFHVLRSADVVTEAGAGGGFQRILESAKAARGKEKMTLTAEQRKKLQEATDSGDGVLVQKLLTEFTEANKNGGATPKKVAKPGEQRGAKQTPPVKKKKTVLAEEDLLEESDNPDDELLDDEDDPDEVDHDQELDDVAESIKDKADDEDDPDDDDDPVDDDPVEESDNPDDTDTGDDPDDDDERVEESESNRTLRRSLMTGARAIRAAAERRKDATEKKELEDRATALEEAARGGKAKKMALRVAGGAKVKKSSGGRGNLSPTVKGKVSTPGQRRPKVTGGSTRESASLELTALQKKLKEATDKNSRLSTQLKLRQNTDRARKLLRESSIPEALRPKVIKELINLDEEAMKSRIEYHESLVDVLLTQVRESAEEDMEFDPIEGAGSRTLRESGGGRRSDIGEDFFEEVGLPLKSK